MNATQRKALYVAAGAVMALLVAYDVITQEMAPAWLNLLAAVLGIVAPVTAARHVSDPSSDYTSIHELDLEGIEESGEVG